MASDNSFVVALGSNLGDRRAHLDFALRGLNSAGITLKKYSRVLETLPEGRCRYRFLNAAVVLSTEMAPRQLLQLLQALELQRGRQRQGHWQDRPLDLDIVLWQSNGRSQQWCSTDLEIPHPRWHQRNFVYLPVLEVAQDWPVPPGHATVQDLVVSQELESDVPVFAEDFGVL